MTPRLYGMDSSPTHISSLLGLPLLLSDVNDGIPHVMILIRKEL